MYQSLHVSRSTFAKILAEPLTRPQDDVFTAVALSAAGWRAGHPTSTFRDSTKPLCQ